MTADHCDNNADNDNDCCDFCNNDQGNIGEMVKIMNNTTLPCPFSHTGGDDDYDYGNIGTMMMVVNYW